MAGADPSMSPGRGDLTGSNVGRFKIGRLLGAGGMGEVYQAEDTLLKRTVAVKRVSRKLSGKLQARQRIIKEAQRASSLNSEHIARVYDVFEENSEVFLGVCPSIQP